MIRLLFWAIFLVGCLSLFASWQGVPLGDLVSEIEEIVRGLPFW